MSRLQGWTLVVASVFLISACGGPPLTPQPDGGSHTVALDSTSMTPSNRECIEPLGAPTCMPVELSVGRVLYDDADGTLQVRWFVDHHGSTGLVDQSIVDPRAQGAAASQYTFAPQSHSPGEHVVAVVVSEGFAEDAADLTQAAAGKTSAQWSWCIDTSGCAPR